MDTAEDRIERWRDGMGDEKKRVQYEGVGAAAIAAFSDWLPLKKRRHLGVSGIG